MGYREINFMEASFKFTTIIECIQIINELKILPVAGRSNIGFINFDNPFVLKIVEKKIAKNGAGLKSVGIPITYGNTLFPSLKRQLLNRNFMLFLMVALANVA